MALQHRKANFLQRAAIHKGISFDDPYILWPDDLLQIAAELDRVLRNDPDILRENDLSNSVKAAEGIIIRTIFKIVDVKNVVFSMKRQNNGESEMPQTVGITTKNPATVEVVGFSCW